MVQYKSLLLAFCLVLADGLFAQQSVFPDSIETFRYNNVIEDYDPGTKSTTYPQYNAAGKLVFEETINSNNPKGTRYYYEYEPGDTLLKAKEFHVWNGSGSWFQNFREEYLRDRMGFDSARQQFSYDGNTGQWKLIRSLLIASSYDSLDRPIEILRADYNHPSAQWSYEERVRLEYKNGETEPYQAFVDVHDGTTWVPMFKGDQLEFGFGFNGDFENTLMTYWKLHAWNGNSWDPYSYDSIGNISGKDYVRYSFEYDLIQLKFDLINTVEFRYDSHGNKIFSEEVDYVNGFADTNGTSIDSFRYGSQNELLLHESYYFEKESGGNKRLGGEKSIYYYGKTGFHHPLQNLTVYPNPVQSGGQLFLPEKDWKVVSLYSLEGKALQIEFHPETKSIQLTQLKPGIYLLRFEDREGKPYQSKIQVQ